MTEFNGHPEKYLSIPISDILWEGDCAKLIRRIERLVENSDSASFAVVASVGDLMALKPIEFTNIKGVGIKYGNFLRALQLMLPERIDLLEAAYIKQNKNNIDRLVREYALQDEIPNIPSKLSKIFLNISDLSFEQKKLLRKIKKIFYRNDVQFILMIERSELARQGGFGVPTLRLFDDLLDVVTTELMMFVTGDKIFDNYSKNYFVIAEYFEVNLVNIDQFLLNDIEDFLFSLSDSDRELIMSRWGFQCESLVLEEIAIKLKITRERVRQKEQIIVSELRSCIRIHPSVIKENILNNCKIDLISLLPILFSCFFNERDFYSCIEAICDAEDGSIYSIQRPSINLTLLDEYFSTNLGAVEQELLVAELVSNCGYSFQQSVNVIKELEKFGKLRFVNGKICPVNLGKSVAIAHIMLSHPNGLPWKDIARVTNISQICGTIINEERQGASYLGDSEYLYLSNRGMYRHRKFLDLSDVDVPGIMKDMFDFLALHKIQNFNLIDFYHNANPSIKRIDYFDLRDIIRSQGEVFGFFFNGKSNVDGVGIIKNFSSSNQRDLILALLNRANGAMTKAEIAECLRSKSIRHANFYLGQMIDNGEVVRIDNMMYTTPEKGFRGVDTNSILMHMKNILLGSDKIVEIDTFRKNINTAIDLSYSKYFYSAIGMANASKFLWKKRHNLFSRSEIPYNSLAAALVSICDLSLSNLENFERIRNEFLITDEGIAIAVQNWRASFK
jgi:hypothetical protein